MLLSPVVEQTEKILEEVLQTIRQEYEGPYPVLCETDRNKFVEEEESLRKQLKEASELESNSFRSLLGLASPRGSKCLKDAQELRQRVRNDINAKVRTRLTGRSNLPPPSIYGQSIARSPETGVGLLPNPEPKSAIITSPLNMRCSLLEPVDSEVNVNPVVQSDHGYTCNINEAILETSSNSSDGSRESSTRRHRRPPPPPPLGRNSPSSSLRRLSVTSSNSGSSSPCRSSSVRRPAPPPPQSPRQSRIPHSPIITSFPSPARSPPDPAMISSISKLAEQMTTLASSVVTDASRQTQGRHRSRRNDFVSKTNCVDINGSNVDGLTVNNGGSNNSGAVIHKTMVPPPCVSRSTPPF